MDKLDILVLPALTVTIVITIAYVWGTWFGKSSARALDFSDEDGESYH